MKLKKSLVPILISTIISCCASNFMKVGEFEGYKGAVIKDDEKTQIIINARDGYYIYARDDDNDGKFDEELYILPLDHDLFKYKDLESIEKIYKHIKKTGSELENNKWKQ